MRHFGYLLLTALCFAVSAVAQVSTANVTGAVEDSSGARIAGAGVKLVNSQTGTENDSTTNQYGIFLLPGVIPGKYILQIERKGFATAQFTGITLNVGDSKQFLIRMKVSSVDQTVVIDAAGMTLNTSDASVSTVVDRKFVANIPLNGRSFQDLISMTPGTVTQSPQAVGPGDFSVNGERPDSNSFTVDGVSGDIGTGMLFGHRKIASTGSYAGTTALGTTQGLVSVDALQEFRVLSSSYPAEYGRTSGAQFSLLTRSGSNTFHGSFYDYGRNDVFDAQDWFTVYDQTYQVKPSFHQQDFGGTLGGPITLYKIYRGQDKSFFFISYEGLRESQPTAPLVQYVPDYSLHSLVPTPLQPVIDAFPYPAARKPYRDGTGLSPFIVNAISLPGHVRSINIRADHNFSPKLSAFLRYGDASSDSQTRTLSSLSITGMKTRTFTFGATGQLSATKSDDFRLGYASGESRLNTVVNQDYSFDFWGNGAIDLNRDLGIPGFYSSARAEVYIRIPGIGESHINTDDASSSIKQWNIKNTFSLQAGHHLLRLGVDQRNIVSTITPPALALEADFFNRDAMLNNLASDVTITKSAPATPVLNEFSAFAQDDWRVSNALSFSLGLRWEVNPPPGEAHGRNAYTLLGDLRSPATLTLAPRGTPLWHTSWNNFAPRFGTAWVADDRPGRELVARAGGGVFFDTANQAAIRAFNAVGFSTAVHPYNVPIPVAASQFDFSPTSSAPIASTTAFAFPSHLQPPYALQWNVAVDKALGKNQTLTISYVGAAGHRLLQSQFTNISGENPNIGEAYYFPGKITSSYQALQVKFQRSISPGLQVLASYALSHTLDYGSTSAAFPLTHGTSDFDVRHNFETALSWDAPRPSGGWVRRNLGSGWGIDGRVFARTAFPVTLLGNVSSDPVTGDRYYSGVDRIPGRPLYLKGSQYPGGRIFNGGPDAPNPAFQLPVGSSPGDLPRNALRGFGAWEGNLAGRRDIYLYERLNMQLRVETFNLFNHPDLGYVEPHLTDELFGQSTLMLNQSFGSTGSLYQQGGPRSIQFMLKLAF
jgi:hypothetical protein